MIHPMETIEIRTKNGVTIGRALALGVLLATLIAAMLLAAGPANASTTFTVNSAADDGDLTPGNGECYTGVDVAAGVKACTLRAAIQEANATSGADAIEFGISGGGVKTIAPATALPKITGPMTIDGYSQPGAKPNTRVVGSDAVLKIELSGAGAPGADGLTMGAANSTVKGLVINRWDQGIRIDGSGATGIKVTGNFIGTDASGTQKLGNAQGVSVYDGSNNTIGGATPAERNVISGNTHSGIGIGDGVVTRSNRVIGNYIGTDKTGTKDLGNTLYGVFSEDAPGTIIGGTVAGARNVISGNGGQGVAISSPGNKVQGNFVGTDATGARDLGNDDNGVVIGDAPNTTVGGTTPAARNVISANNSDGVVIEGAEATGNKVMGNYLGTDRSGTKDLGNSTYGVFISGASNNTIGGTQAGARNVISGNGDGVLIYVGTGNSISGNYIGTDKNGSALLGNTDRGVAVYYAPNNTIGGTQAGAGNVISANGGDGVQIYGGDATGNRVLSNSLFANGGLGIDLGDDGPTPNDPKDPDTGPNYLQNRPVLSSATTSATSTTVPGTLNSTPNKTFLIQFFSNPSGEEGKTFRGNKNVTTDANGNASFAFTTVGKVGVGGTMTATATGAGNTSEFSAPRRVVAQ